MGVVDDSGVHLVDLLVYFAGGRIRDLRARVLGENHTAHSFTCFFETTTSVTVSACASYLSPTNSVQEETSVFGTNGAIFARRFCKEWNTKPPRVFFKSSDGRVKEEFDLSLEPRGRDLPLKTLLGVLEGKLSKDALISEGKSTLEAHRAIELIRNSSLSSVAPAAANRS